VENAFDQIARVDRTTGKFDEFPLSVKDPVARKLGADWTAICGWDCAVRVNCSGRL
jgi:hypothetical protein